jgi:uncharacterized membrane protein
VGAAPAWFADNLLLIAAVVLAVLTILVLRVVTDAVTKTILLGLIVAVAVFAYVNRASLKACAATCECRVAQQDIEVPLCDPHLDI